MNILHDLFLKLHSNPELSLHEHKTKGIIIDFLKNNTSLKIIDEGAFLYAVHFEDAAFENIGFRADMDAIKDKDGRAFHGCGHDGHTVTLCNFALNIEGKAFGKNIYLFFQPAEETGEGAILLLDSVKKLNISRIYGFHNIPKYEPGQVLLKNGTFACASKGVTLKFTGKQSHAAYPENGINPSFAITKVVSSFNDILSSEKYSGLVLATIVNISVGEKAAFGVNAGFGELSVTIRAEYDTDLLKLQNELLESAKSACKQEKIALEYSIFDEFPSTFNSEKEFLRAKDILNKNNIPYKVLTDPMRWSEDFGHYLKTTGGMFFGIGAGINQPDLHTSDYCYNLDVTEYATKIFMLLI